MPLDAPVTITTGPALGTDERLALTRSPGRRSSCCDPTGSSLPLAKGGLGGGVVKRRFWTNSEFIPISAHSFPPLAKGGLGGVVPAERMAWYAGPELLGLAEVPAWPSMFVMPCPPPLTPPSQGGERARCARFVIRSRPPKTRVSKPSREHIQPRGFINPDRGGVRISRGRRRQFVGHLFAHLVPDKPVLSPFAQDLVTDRTGTTPFTRGETAPHNIIGYIILYSYINLIRPLEGPGKYYSRRNRTSWTPRCGPGAAGPRWRPGRGRHRDHRG